MHTDYQYRLRAGSPFPTKQGLVLHIFGSEKSQIDVYGTTNSLPSSNEFKGQGGNYISASFSRLADIGGDTFSGKIVHAPELSSSCSIGKSKTDTLGFIDCTSLNISYNVFGLATLSFAVVHPDSNLHVRSSIKVGGQTFTGTVTNASLVRIPNTTWHETHVTLIAMTSGLSYLL